MEGYRGYMGRLEGWRNGQNCSRRLAAGGEWADLWLDYSGIEIKIIPKKCW